MLRSSRARSSPAPLSSSLLVAASYSDAALGGWRRDPPLAYARLDTAQPASIRSARNRSCCKVPWRSRSETRISRAGRSSVPSTESRRIGMPTSSSPDARRVAGNTAAARANLARSLALNPNDKVADKVRRLPLRGAPDRSATSLTHASAAVRYPVSRVFIVRYPVSSVFTIAGRCATLSLLITQEGGRTPTCDFASPASS